jgi:hypothetical protein
MARPALVNSLVVLPAGLAFGFLGAFAVVLPVALLFELPVGFLFALPVVLPAVLPVVFSVVPNFLVAAVC